MGLTSRTRGRWGLPVPFLPGDDGIAEHADALDLALHHVARLEVQSGGLGRLKPATPDTVPVESTSPAE